MAEWRARGYVADSDEDDDSQGSSSTPHPPPNLELFHDIDDLLEPDKGQLKHDDATKSEDSQQRKVVEKGRHNGDEDAAREQTERSDLEGAGSDSDQAETKQRGRCPQERRTKT